MDCGMFKEVTAAAGCQGQARGGSRRRVNQPPSGTALDVRSLSLRLSTQLSGMQDLQPASHPGSLASGRLVAHPSSARCFVSPQKGFHFGQKHFHDLIQNYPDP